METGFSFQTVGYPTGEEYPDDIPPCTTAERLLHGMTAHLLATLQIAFCRIFAREDEQYLVQDIFEALQNPGILHSISPVAVFVVAGIRRELVYPLLDRFLAFMPLSMVSVKSPRDSYREC